MENLTKSLALEYAGQGIASMQWDGSGGAPINKAWIDSPKARGEVEATFRWVTPQTLVRSRQFCVPGFG